MEQQHRQEAAGRRGERELNPFRHVQPKPPANAGTEEFRQGMLQMEQRFAPRVFDSRTRALELERELKSGTSTGVSEPEGFLRTPQPKPTPGPQFPSLRTVILLGSAPGLRRKQHSGLLASDPLDHVDRRLLSPEPASVALPLSPASADPSKFLVLSSPTREVSAPEMEAITPHPKRDGSVITPGLTPGQITPPPRPTPPPTAPRRSARRVPQEFSRTPGPLRAGIQARGTGGPRTAPPIGPVSYSHMDQPTGQRLGQAGPTTQQRGGRRISPTYVSPPIGGSSKFPFMVDIRPTAGSSTQPAPPPTTQSVFDRLSSSSLTQRSRNSAALATPHGPRPARRPVPPTEMPLSFLAPEHTTPFPGMRTAHNIRDTLRKVAAETPKGSSERTTPADSTVIRKSLPTSRRARFQLKEASASNLRSALTGLSNCDEDLRDLQDNSPLVGKSIKAASVKEQKKTLALKNHASTTKSGNTSRELLQLSSGQKALEPVANPQAFGSGAMDSTQDPHGHTPSGVTLEETLDSLESLCNSIKRIESTMKDYRTNLKVDAKELKRGQNPSSYLQDNNTKEGLIKSQHYHSDRVESLIQDFRKKESIYHKNLDSLRRLDEDPLLDPTVSIPSMNGKDEHKQRIAFRGRLHLRDTLKKLGYRGSLIRPFLEQLDEDIWKVELTEAIIATDPGISEAIQLLNQQGYNLERGSEIDFEGVDLKDLSSLPWGSFKLKGLEGTIGRDDTDETDHRRREDKGKGKATIQGEKETGTPEASSTQALRRTPTPTILESGSEGEVDYEQSFMTDPGMTPHLRNRLS
ncbi:uncharacterized protein DFL_008375 [Arthrobotrys flagrans]|uniref:Uncharacterized protein n=1 Tax=Arthrobotrys flagrans TaxID=97331 RepID=A0A436ZNJ8_ARTFL|nr:hypothetical protein DFL_008375 [Arthrobotrys flagrans]